MILKSLSRKSNSNQLLNYVFRYVLDSEKSKNAQDVSQQTNGFSDIVLRHNVRARSLQGILNAFKENESYRLIRRKDSVKIYHTIISFSNLDNEHVNEKVLKEIARKYMELRGENNLAVAVSHWNTDSTHLHVVHSGVQLNGRSSRISKRQFQTIKHQLQEFQKTHFPELEHSLPAHGGKQSLSKETILNLIKKGRQTHKQALIECIETAYNQFKSKDEFLRKLTEFGHEPYLRNGALQGIKYEGKTKFRFSRLGFDEKMFETLDQKIAKPDKVLQELYDIRTEKNIHKKTKRLEELEKTTEATNEISTNELDALTLAELATIREKSAEKELQRSNEVSESTIDPSNPPSLFDALRKTTKTNDLSIN